jgi:hypothetical protein
MRVFMGVITFSKGCGSQSANHKQSPIPEVSRLFLVGSVLLNGGAAPILKSIPKLYSTDMIAPWTHKSSVR